MILQHAYRPILNFIYDKITFRLNDRTRKILLFVCFFAIFAAQFAAQYIFKFQGFNRGIRDYFICLMMGIIILVSVDRKLEIVKWNLWTYVPFTVTGILLLIASLDHDMGPAYQAFPLAMLVAFMCLFYVWGNRKDYEVLFDAAAWAYFLFVLFLILLCFFKYPTEYYGTTDRGLEYAPFGINPNGVAKIFLLGIVVGVYWIYLHLHSIKRVIFGGVMVGCCTIITLLTHCRAGEIAILLIGLFCLVFIFSKFIKEREKFKRNLKNVLIGTIVILCGCLAGYFILTHVSDKIYDLCHQNVTLEQSQSVNSEEPGTSVSEERQRVISENLEHAKQVLYARSYNYYLWDLFFVGRLAIWNTYAQHMSWRGESTLLFFDTEYAHNQYIELSYKAGIPTGFVYLFFNLLVGVLVLIRFFKQRNRTSLLMLLTFGVFFIISMLDTGVLPFERGFIFLYYITLTPLFFRREKQKKIPKA